MKTETSAIEIIKKRRSVRTYKKIDFDGALTDQINTILQNHTEGPFGNKVLFSLVEKKLAKENNKIKLGTYGFISGAQYFIASQVKNTPNANIDVGYLLEKIILQLTALDLGTCWLGGTFSRSDFSDILSSESDTIIPAITPVGYPADSMSVRENIIRWGAKADSRKKWEELFFSDSMDSPLSKEEAGPYEIPLEMLRLAPSASNKQPWRVIKTVDAFHFYLKRTPGYGKISKGVDLQMIDMGIAMAHFEISCTELSQEGKWNHNDPGMLSGDTAKYCISWMINS